LLLKTSFYIYVRSIFSTKKKKKKKNNTYFIHLIVYVVCAVHTLVRRYSATRVGVRHRSWCTRGPGSTGTGILSRESAPAAMGGTRAKGDHDGVTAGTCTTRTRVVLLLSYFIMLGKKNARKLVTSAFTLRETYDNIVYVAYNNVAERLPAVATRFENRNIYNIV